MTRPESTAETTPALPEMIILIESLGHMLSVLSSHGIAAREWGRDGKRSAYDLYREITDGESVLYLDDEFRLRKYSRAVKMNVVDHTGTYRLYEAERLDPATGMTKVPRPLKYSLGEKIKEWKGEQPETAALRALQEELGIEEPLELHSLGRTVWGEREDFDFPGLIMVSDTNYFEAQISESDYREEYREEGRVITTFRWQKRETDTPAQ